MEKTTYNINELLDMRKHLEGRLLEIMAAVSYETLVFKVEQERDHVANTTKVIRSTEKKTLSEVMNAYSAIMDELVSVKAAITKYNATVLQARLFQRDGTRAKIEYLKKVRVALPLEPRFQRQILHQDKEGTIQASIEINHQPFFERAEVDKMLDQFAKEERKLNTEIQKLNLEQKIEI